MSLIDPSTRWWNRNGPRRTAAWLCWALGTAAYLVGGWWTAVSPDDGAPAWLVPTVSTVGLMLLLAGIFLHLLSDDGDEFEPRVVFFPIAALFVALGIGGIARALSDGDDVPALAIGFAAAGAVTLVATELLSRRLAGRRALQAKVERSGVTTSGQVTRARGYAIDYSPVTRVTVTFVDREGRTHWVSQTIGGSRKVGDRVKVRYSPDDVHRKAGVIIQPA